MMLVRSTTTNNAAKRVGQRLVASARCMSSVSDVMYKPTLTERRVGEGGPGGRSSEAALKVALFGASGFLGRYLCHELGTNGYVAYLANRGDDLEMRDTKVSFDLGRTRYVFYSPRDRESIREVIADADVVVNMIGKYYESGQPVQTSKFPYVTYQKNYSFQDVNVTVAKTLAEICREMQVDHFVHVSSASASPDAKSEWSRTKYEGEQAVKEIYPWATIIRPTQLFGRQDRFLHWFARMQQWYKVVPLVNGGKTLTQPVFVGDVGKTILRVCDDAAKFEGRQIDCFGPTDYTYKELAKFVEDITERKQPIIDVPYDILRRLASVMQYTRDPLLTPDLVDIWSEDFLQTYNTQEEYNAQESAAGNKILTMADLGVESTPVEKIAFEFLQAYRPGGHFHRAQGYHADAQIDIEKFAK